MSLRWELVRTQPDNARTEWFLLDNQEPLAMLSVQASGSPIKTDSHEWQRVEIAPEVWLVAGATLELLPGVQACRISRLQLPPFRDGPLALTFPPLP